MTTREMIAEKAGNPGTLVVSRWEHFPHEADVGIRGIGPTKSDAFAQAACALVAIIADLGTIRPVDSATIVCHAPNDEFLLVDWLNGVVYQMATRRMLFSDFTVALDAGVLHGKARGEPVDVARHKPVVEVKGATLAELRVACDNHGEWVAQCIVDV